MAEGGDFGGSVGSVDVVQHQNDAEVCADLLGAREQRDDFGGRSAGCYVEVFGGVFEEQVADASAGEVGLVAGGAEGCGDVARGGEARAVGKPQNHGALSLVDAGLRWFSETSSGEGPHGRPTPEARSRQPRRGAGFR